QWDNELAVIAQTWANQCHYGHDSCRNVGKYKQISRFKVGQNVAEKQFTSGREPDPMKWIEVLNKWYNEVRNYDYREVSAFKGLDDYPVTGHYTQMIWAGTNRVGCGFVSFKTKYIPFSYSELYVCNYGSAGNVLGRPVYLQGEPCSQCRRGCYKGLCL
ncbi:hypothetical protein C0J52_22451, partial [Blattella germanica]